MTKVLVMINYKFQVSIAGTSHFTVCDICNIRIIYISENVSKRKRHYSSDFQNLFILQWFLGLISYCDSFQNSFVSIYVTIFVRNNIDNKIGLLLCHSHIELRLWLRLSWLILRLRLLWTWGWNQVEMRLSRSLVDLSWGWVEISWHWINEEIGLS